MIKLALLGLLAVCALWVRRHVRVEYERRPRIWRAEWSGQGAPSQCEVADALRRLEQQP